MKNTILELFRIEKSSLNKSGRDLASSSQAERQRGLWSFLTWSFVLAQIVAGEQFFGRAFAGEPESGAKSLEDQSAGDMNGGSTSELLMENAADHTQSSIDAGQAQETGRFELAAAPESEFENSGQAVELENLGQLGMQGSANASTGGGDGGCNNSAAGECEGESTVVEGEGTNVVELEGPADLGLPELPTEIAIDLGLDVGADSEFALELELSPVADLGLYVDLDIDDGIGIDLEVASVVELDVDLDLDLTTLDGLPVVADITNVAESGLDAIADAPVISDVADVAGDVLETITVAPVIANVVDGLKAPIEGTLSEISPVIDSATGIVTEAVETVADASVVAAVSDTLTSPLEGAVSGLSAIEEGPQSVIATTSDIIATTSESTDLADNVVGQVEQVTGLVPADPLQVGDSIFGASTGLSDAIGSDVVTIADSTNEGDGASYALFEGTAYTDINIELHTSPDQSDTSLSPSSGGLVGNVVTPLNELGDDNPSSADVTDIENTENLISGDSSVIKSSLDLFA